MSTFVGDPDYNILKHTDNFKEIFDEFFGPVKVKNRYRQWLNLYNMFAARYITKGKVALNTVSLRETLHAYFREVIKVKVFHKDIESLDEENLSLS